MRAVAETRDAAGDARPGRHDGGAERGRRDGGFTFVETVLTVVLIGVVIVPVLAAVRGAVRMSSVSGAAAQVETVLVNAADRVQRAPNLDADACDFAGFAQAAAVSTGWSADQVQVRQEYLDASGWVAGPATGPACPGSGNQPRLAKRITITVTSASGSVTRSMQVVKSDV